MKLVTDAHEFREALRLRYRVFNVELKEGLAASHSTGHDFDEFDAVVDHIIVKCPASGSVIGTYRLQTGLAAAKNIGYYGEREFDFAPYEPLRGEVLELGRACIEQQHRSTPVLTHLWKAIAQYALLRGCRYLIGCSSLTSQDPVVGSRVYAQMQNFMAPPEMQTAPQEPFAFELCDAGQRSRPRGSGDCWVCLSLPAVRAYADRRPWIANSAPSISSLCST